MKTSKFISSLFMGMKLDFVLARNIIPLLTLWQAYSLLLSHQVDKGRNDTHWYSDYEIAILAKSLAETVVNPP